MGCWLSAKLLQGTHPMWQYVLTAWNMPIKLTDEFDVHVHAGVAWKIFTFLGSNRFKFENGVGKFQISFGQSLSSFHITTDILSQFQCQWASAAIYTPIFSVKIFRPYLIQASHPFLQWMFVPWANEFECCPKTCQMTSKADLLDLRQISAAFSVWAQTIVTANKHQCTKDLRTCL